MKLLSIGTDTNDDSLTNEAEYYHMAAKPELLNILAEIIAFDIISKYKKSTEEDASD
jgi:hypothetical protein